MKKESLSIIFVKTLLVVLLFAGMGTIIIGGGYIVWEYSKNKISNQIVKPIDPELEKYCAGDSCCLASLRIMRENNYEEAYNNEKCPEGYRMNSLRCITSYSWCVPMEEDCKKHGEIPDYTVPGDDMSVQCCSGLKHEIQKKYFDENCVNLYEKYGYGGYAGICINCGDDICDAEFENKCNCPEDCGDNILVSCCDLECGQYKYSNCPEGCAKSCIGSCSACADCEGEGSCYCQDDCDELKIINTSDWQTYRNEEFGFEVKYQDNDKIVIGGNPNYFCLKKKDINDFYRCYIYINFLHILDEEYHESYKGITYDNLEQYIEYLYSVKRKGYNKNDYIVKMERVKNNEGTDILEVIIGDEATDYSRKEYYIEYDDAIYGNYKNEKDYLTISRGATYLLNADEKEQQSEQFEQILSTFKFTEK